MKEWITPEGTAHNLYLDMLKQPHLLIAGATGSGKSVIINALIYTALYSSPTSKQFILIDPKRVELVDYKPLPHTITYASETPDIIAALDQAIEIMESRYKSMARRHIKDYNGGDLYIIIDEFADLVVQAKKPTFRACSRLAQLGRAAHVHLIIATQRPTRDIVTGTIKVNLDSRIGLRCPTAIDSRNIINIKGAETLPRYGYGYYLTPETMTPQLIQIPFTPAAELAARVQWWTDQNKTPLKWFYRPV